MILPLVTVPNPNLNKRSIEVDLDFLNSEEFKILVPNMIETMYRNSGIGLAAPQIGKNIRVCVIGKEAFKNNQEDLVLINPTFNKLSKKTTMDTEGCLSVPKKAGKIKRSKDIFVKAINKDGMSIEFEAHGMAARVIQHEIDHLDGILFINRTEEIFET